MTTRSGNTYNPMGDPANIPSSSNPPEPPSSVSRLESAFVSFATEMRAQVAEIRKDLNDSINMTNRRLNGLEHPEPLLHRERRTPPHEDRPSPPPRHRSIPLPINQPIYVDDQGSPPLSEYGYPPPGYNPHVRENRPFHREQRHHPREIRRPPREANPFPFHREQHVPRPPPNPYREPGYRPYNHEEQVMKGVKIEAPTFDGQLDPTKFIDWLADMDHYFEWYEMSDERRVRFAKMKLVSQAKLYWTNYERLMTRGHRVPVISWDEMKEVLKEKYVPVTYRQRMLDQWQRLNQGSRPVGDYISKFDEFLSRCDLQEDEQVVLSRFRAGLREDLQRELHLREVSTLPHAYQMVQEIDRFAKLPAKRFDPPSRSNPPARPTQYPPQGPSASIGQPGAPSPFEIGRASCRERVCQYV